MLPRIPSNTNSASENLRKEEVRGQRKAAFADIENLVSNPSSNRADPQIAISLMQSFAEELRKNDTSLIAKMTDELKDMFKDLSKQITSIADKTTEQTDQSLENILKKLEAMLVKAEAEGDTETANFARGMKEQAFQQLFEERGIAGNRSVREKIGIPSAEKLREGYQNFKDKLANSDGITGKLRAVGSTIRESSPVQTFSRGFRQSFAGGLFYSDEEQRQDLRARLDKDNRSMASANYLGEQVNTAIDGVRGIRTPSDIEEIQTQNRDLDTEYMRSGLDYDPKDHWEKLLKILNEIKECVCDCDRCPANDNDRTRMPMPIPMPTGVRTPVSIPTSVPTRVGTPVSIPTSVRTPVALPAPTRTTSSAPRALPAPGRPAPTLDELGLNRERERVRVRGRVEADPNLRRTASGRTVAEQRMLERSGALNPDGTTKSAAEIREARRQARGVTPSTPARQVVETGARSTATRAGARAAGKSLLKKIPGVSLVAGGVFAAQRALQGDFVGAGMELASGAVGTVPGLGTAASVGIDAALAGRDMGLIGNSSTPASQSRAVATRPASRPGMVSRAASAGRSALGAGRSLVSTASTAGRGILSSARNIVPSMGRALPGAGRMLGMGARVLGKVAAPLAVGMAAYDGYQGFNADPNASTGRKLLNAGSSALNGLTFGLLGSSADEIATEAQTRPQIESGRNIDSQMIARGTDSMQNARNQSSKPVINVPPPTVISAGGKGENTPVINTPTSPRPSDSTWLAWQKTRSSFAV